MGSIKFVREGEKGWRVNEEKKKNFVEVFVLCNFFDLIMRSVNRRTIK